MTGHIHDAISLHPQIDAGKENGHNHLERCLADNRVSIIFMTKPNIILYTLQDEQSRILYTGSGTYNIRITEFNNPVEEITNFSIEKELRVGVLLTDGCVMIYNLNCNRWIYKNTINTNIDLSLRSGVVFARTLNACFWVEQESSKNGGKASYKVQMHTLINNTTKTIMKGIAACIIQCLQGTLALLFKEHGVMFVEFKQIYGDCYHEMLRLTLTQSSEDLRINATHQALSRSSSVPMLAQSNAISFHQVKEAYYWNPETNLPVAMKEVNSQLFAKATKNKLRSYCLDKDRIELIVLYGETVYRLTTQSCLPTIKLEIPSSILESSQIHLMHLKKVTVLIGNTAVVAYRGSRTPVVTIRNSYKVAKYGHVWNRDGLFRINMNSPEDTKPRYDCFNIFEDTYDFNKDYFAPPPPARPHYMRYGPPHGSYARG